VTPEGGPADHLSTRALSADLGTTPAAFQVYDPAVPGADREAGGARYDELARRGPPEASRRSRFALNGRAMMRKLQGEY